MEKNGSKMEKKKLKMQRCTLPSTLSDPSYREALPSVKASEFLRSIVTTCLVVLSNKLQFWKNRLRRRTKRRSVMGTTDRRRVSFQKT